MNIRTNFTLPEEVVSALIIASKEVGLCKSAYVSMAIKNQINLDKLMRELPVFTRGM